VKDDFDDPAGPEDLGFDPPVSATAAEGGRAGAGTGTVPTALRAPRRASWGRKLAAGAILTSALVAMGGAYTLFAGSSGASASGNSAADIAAGRQLYETSCITCHGANLQGVKNRGVSLLGVGGAAVYFQVSTGRMPANQQQSQQYRKPAKFDDQQTRELAAYIESVGGGPTIPAGSVRGSDADVAEGGNLFRLNCASCHGTTFKGAPLSAGKTAPSLNESTDLQIYTAMLTGPESMPIFSDNLITPDQKRAIVAYVQTMKASADPGGSGIDRIGPVSEAIVIWVAGVGALIVAMLWIGAKTQ
jgi:ubiquinol-cytochrome c reductase cytochrome c subunit